MALTRLLSASLSMLPARGRRLPPLCQFVARSPQPARGGGQGAPLCAVQCVLAVRADPCGFGIVVAVPGRRGWLWAGGAP